MVFWHQINPIYSHATWCILLKTTLIVPLILKHPADHTQVTNTRIFYHVDMYGNPEIGFKMYPKEMGVKVFRASSEVYLTERFLQSYISDLQHTFTSSEGKAESYNETFVNSDEVNFFETFLLFNPHVGGHFDKKTHMTAHMMKLLMVR